MQQLRVLRRDRLGARSRQIRVWPRAEACCAAAQTVRAATDSKLGAVRLASSHAQRLAARSLRRFCSATPTSRGTSRSLRRLCSATPTSRGTSRSLRRRRALLLQSAFRCMQESLHAMPAALQRDTDVASQGSKRCCHRAPAATNRSLAPRCPQIWTEAPTSRRKDLALRRRRTPLPQRACGCKQESRHAMYWSAAATSRGRDHELRGGKALL